MTLTLTFAHLIGAAAIIVPLASTALYWAVKTAIRAEIISLELRVSQGYMTIPACRQIRAECERHRHADGRQ